MRLVLVPKGTLLTVLRSQSLITLASALITIPSPDNLFETPSTQETHLTGRPYPWSLTAYALGERISYSKVCPVDVPTARDNPSEREANEVILKDSRVKVDEDEPGGVR